MTESEGAAVRRKVDWLEMRIATLERQMSLRTKPTGGEMDQAQRDWIDQYPDGHPLERRTNLHKRP